MERGIVGGDHAALARIHGLRRREREDAGVPVGAQEPSATLRAQRLRRIADQRQAVVPAQGLQRAVVGAATVHVHHHHGAGPGTDGGAGLVHVEGEAQRLHIDQPDVGAGEPHRVGGGDEGEVGNDDLVAGTDALAHERQRDGRRAAGYRDAMAGADGGGDPRFEGAGHLAVVDVAAFQDLGDARLLVRPHLGPEPGNPFPRRHRVCLFRVPFAHPRIAPPIGPAYRISRHPEGPATASRPFFVALTGIRR